MKKINTAGNLSTITKDQTSAQDMITQEMFRLENFQNAIIGNSGKITNTIMNGYRSNTLSGQNDIQTNTTANLYASGQARDNVDIVTNQATQQLSDLAIQNGTSAVGDVSSFFTKGVGTLYNLENYKRQLALNEASTMLDIKKGIADLNLGWANYNLDKEIFEFTKETNKANEALGKEANDLIRDQIEYANESNKRKEGLASDANSLLEDKLAYTIESNKRSEALSAK